MTLIKLRILGESVIEVGESRFEPSATHVFALTLYLAIERDKLVARSVLASLLFPATPPQIATRNLRQLVYRLRQKGVPLECTSSTVMLRGEHVSGIPESVVGQSYTDALNDSSGRVLLPGYEPPTMPFSVWLESYRDSLTHKLQTRIAKDLHRARQGADWRAVERFARSLLALDPLNESATLGLAEAMARAGSKQRAVKLLHDYAQDVGASHEKLALPSRFLTRRISEDVVGTPLANTQLIGRTRELRELTASWEQARQAHCSLALLKGEKSIGKTRVLDELAELVRLDGSGAVLRHRPLPGDRERPMSLFSDLCRQLLRLPGGAGCSPDSLRYLHRLLDAPPEGSASRVPDAEASASAAFTRRAILDVLDSVASERPILVCIDDADRLDSPSIDFLATLSDFASTTSAFFVLATPPGRLPQLNRGRVVYLSPMPADDARQLAEQLCAATGGELSSASIDWCVAVASGNPGHLELLLQHLTSRCDTPSVPPSLLVLLDERLQLLPQSARHVLQACAIFGSECRPDTISALTGLNGYELLSILESLIVEGLLSDTTQGVACRSSLFADRVGSTMSHAVRSLLNKRAAEHLENLVDADLPSQSMAWRIADHWQSAGNQARSLHWRRVCWQQLLSIGQPLAAAESIRSYLACSPSLTARVRMLDQLAEALRHASDAKGQLQVLEERKALSDKVGDADAVRLALAADTAEACFHSFDDTTKLLPDLRSLLRAVLLDEERRLRIARVLIVTADSMLSEPLAREAVEAVPETPRTARSASTGLEVKLIYHATFGDRKTAVELADLLHAAAEKQELSPAKVMSHLTASLGLRIVDTRPLELSLLARLYEQCVDASMFGVAIRIASRLGSMLHEDGEIETATEWCARTSALIDKSGIQRLATEYVTLRIDLALGNQDFDLASRLIELAPTQFPMYSSPKWSNAYHVYLTRVQQRQGQLRLSPERLTRLLDWHFAAQQLGRHDDHMEVLWTALRAEGRSDYASELLSSYLLRFRRELRPCIFSLRSRTADDPAWSETLLCSASPAKRPARRHRQLSSLGNA